MIFSIREDIMVRTRIIPGQIYRHFKGNLYQIICVAYHSETGERMVIYQALYGEFGICARPYDMFISPVDREKYPDALQKLRFELVRDASDSINQFHKDKEEKAKDDAEKAPSQKNGEKEQGAKETTVKKTAVLKEDAGKIIEETAVVKTSGEPETDETGEPDPDLIRFLNAPTYGEKRDVLLSLRNKMTEKLLNAITESIDFVPGNGGLLEKFDDVEHCLKTRSRYEGRRLR